jgi:threonine synthase
MGSTLSFEHRGATPHLQLIADIVSHTIILSSTSDAAKTAQQIALENNLPISSTYKHY